MTDFVYGILLPMGLTGAVCALALALLQPALRRVPARWHRWAVATGTALFLLPLPALLCLLPQRAAAGQTAPLGTGALADFAPTAPLYTAGQALGGTAGHTPVAPAATGVDWALVLALTYLVGLAVAALLFAVRYALLLRRVRREARPIEEGETLRLYRALCAELAVKNPPALCETHAAKTPLLVGLLRPRILLPAHMATGQDTDYALRHELTHYKQGDIQLLLAAQLARILHWYNPLAHLLRRFVADAAEAACDERVAAALSPGGRHAYALALLAHCGPQHTLAAGFSTPARRLKKRLARLMAPTAVGRGARVCTLALLLALAATGVLAGCSLAAGALTETSSPQSSLASSGTPGENSSSESPAKPYTTSLPDEERPAAPQPAEGGALIHPLPGGLITRGYVEEHQGNDYKADAGSPIVAAAGGVVVTAGWHWSYGWMVVIDHGGGTSSLYAHCQELFVEEGAVVQQGEVIAAVGSTGETTGTQLHFEVIIEGERTDPSPHLPPEGT